MLATSQDLQAWLEDAKLHLNWKDLRVRRDTNSVLWAKNRGIVAFVEGITEVAGQNVTLRLGLTDKFPDQTPFVQLASPKLGRFLAHVEIDQTICYTNARDIVTDSQRPAEIVCWAAERAVETLQKSLTTPNDGELLDEFTAYWRQYISQSDRESSKRVVVSLIELADVVTEVQLVVDQDAKSPKGDATTKSRKPRDEGQLQALFVTKDMQTLTDYKRSFEQEYNLANRTALYLPLMNTNIEPPHPDQPWDADVLKRVVRENLSDENLQRLDQILETRSARRDFLVLGVPRPNHSGDGRYGLVGVAVMRPKQVLNRDHVLLEAGCVSGYQISLRNVQRQDRQFVMRRGGSDASLAKKRVLLLGVGSLGGHLAQMLAAAGVGSLTFVDDDVLSSGNVFRHILGRYFVGVPKVEGVKGWLEDHYPYLKVIPEKCRVAALFQRYDFHINSYDLIIDATANSTNHLNLAQYLNSYADRPPVIATWLDPLGIGGHVVVNFGGKSGCLRCLYSDPTYSLHNLASFAEPDQDFATDAIGCGSYFTAFSDLDAIRTSELAARKTVEVLHGKLSQNLVYSWKGSPDVFLAADFQLAPRFDKSSEKNLHYGVTYACDHCAICRGAA